MTRPEQRATSPTLAFDIGPVRLLARHPSAAARARFVRAMDPLLPAAAGGREPDVVVSFAGEERPRFAELQKAARDGTVTASADGRLYVLAGEEWCSVPDVAAEQPTTIMCSAGFPLEALSSTVLRSAVQLAMLPRRGCSIHSAAVADGSAGVVVAGWSESGKTETALALAERGARFVSDKWTVVRAPDRELSSFPISVGIRRWVLPYLPRLRAALPRAARAQLSAAGVAGAAVAPLVRRPRGGVLGLGARALEGAVALGDRASVRQSTLQALYGDGGAEPATLDLLVVLRTTPADEIAVTAVDPAAAATRLARSASYERRGLFDLLDRRRYAYPDISDDPRRDLEVAEAALLRELLADARAIEVTAPFPVDPRRVADAIERWS